MFLLFAERGQELPTPLIHGCSIHRRPDIGAFW